MILVEIDILWIYWVGALSGANRDSFRHSVFFRELFEMTVSVICVMGLPGAGKSSLCEYLSSNTRLRECLTSMAHVPNINILTLSFDSMEAELKKLAGVGHNVFNAEIWRQARTMVTARVLEIRRQFEAEREILTVVLLDDNMYYKSMRKVFRPNGVIFISRDVNECLRLNSNREYPVPASIIENMSIIMEVPEYSVSCPVLTISPPLNCSKEELAAMVLDNGVFWEAILSSVYSQVLVDKTQPALTLSHREFLLNNFQVKLRSCVSDLASRTRSPLTTMKVISRLKSSYMEKLKSKLANDPDSEPDLEELVMQFLVELAHLT